MANLTGSDQESASIGGCVFDQVELQFAGFLHCPWTALIQAEAAWFGPEAGWRSPLLRLHANCSTLRG
jgi:hypothetical protein